ncbi:MAG: peptidylprolyl isomerase [Proteobacteria bacterium]|nr:MAG: peptidylprolyl isomerase [Pseudomonadota bacterium]
MIIAKNTIATLHYTLKDDNDEVLDVADANHPFLYMHGVGGMIPGLEKALENKKVGDKVVVSVAPAEAYGERNPTLTQDVPREMFENISDEDLVVGAQFHAKTDQGMEIITVAAVDGDTIKIDGNHPMAGETLHFDVDVVDVREATEEEISHGHPHGPGGHQH